MSQRYQNPDVYPLSPNTVVLDTFAIDNLDTQQKQRMLSYLAHEAAKSHGVIDAVCAEQSLTLYFSPEAKLEQLIPYMEKLWQNYESDDFAPHTHRLKVRYGAEHGIDLAEVATLTDLSEKQVIDLHKGGQYQVDFLGFQPGFPYISGLNKQLQIPRRATPRTKVPAGSIAIANDKTAIYPKSSPGGWHIIGHVTTVLFDQKAKQPALFAPGDIIIFEE